MLFRSRAVISLPKRVSGRYNVHMPLKITKRMYVFVGVLGLIVGVAYILQRHYFFGAIYALFGGIWLLISRKNPRAETAVQPAEMGLGSPVDPPDTSGSTARNISKLPQS